MVSVEGIMLLWVEIRRIVATIMPRKHKRVKERGTGVSRAQNLPTAIVIEPIPYVPIEPLHRKKVMNALTKGEGEQVAPILVPYFIYLTFKVRYFHHWARFDSFTPSSFIVGYQSIYQKT
jgi:hypothetical protein